MIGLCYPENEKQVHFCKSIKMQFRQRIENPLQNQGCVCPQETIWAHACIVQQRTTPHQEGSNVTPASTSLGHERARQSKLRKRTEHSPCPHQKIGHKAASNKGNFSSWCTAPTSGRWSVVRKLHHVGFSQDWQRSRRRCRLEQEPKLFGQERQLWSRCRVHCSYLRRRTAGSIA